MSNKPKHAKNIVKHIDTPAERSYKGIVKQAMSSSKRYGGSKHIGSKPISVLKQYCTR